MARLQYSALSELRTLVFAFVELMMVLGRSVGRNPLMTSAGVYVVSSGVLYERKPVPAGQRNCPVGPLLVSVD